MIKTVPMTSFFPIHAIALHRSTSGSASCKKAILALLGLALVFCSMAQTSFTTKAKGAWTNPGTWEGGIAPTRNIAAGVTVNIRHEVSVNLTDDILLYGTINILGDTLRFPATYTKRTYIYSTGLLRVLNGGFIQDIPANQSDVEIKAGRVLIENSVVHIGKHFKNYDGRRTIKNSWVKVGETYEADGSSSLPSRDSIQYSTIEANLSHSGHFELKDDSYLSVANARIFVTNGDFKTAGRGYINTLPGAASGYGFDLIKATTHLDVDGPWDARIYTHCVGGDIKGSKVADIDFVRTSDCSLSAVPTPPASSGGQMVINEVYTDPAGGKHEFLELYNINNQPEQMDSYTFVTFFDQYPDKGFYVLDFPKLVVNPKDLFVASSDFPFNYQGATNSLNTSFNWNKASLLNGASLRKWVVTNGTGNLVDGNVFYDEAPLPAEGLNDLLFRLSGDISYTFLLYKNGVLINKIIAGAGGLDRLSTSITSMPSLYVDMAGSSPDFTINFNSYTTMPVEKITSDAGNDNGFTRTVDGACGSFRKSSNSTKHTPGESNGTLSTTTSGDVTINSSITRGTSATGSYLTYTVFGPSSSLPVEIRVMVDNGTVTGQLDAMDTQVDFQTASISGQTFSTTFQPFDKDIFIMVKQGTGCIDRLIMPSVTTSITLPLQFVQFTATKQPSAVDLVWATEEEKDLGHFVVQRSTDGKTFYNIGTVYPGEKTGSSFHWKDKSFPNETPVRYYRIKAVLANGSTTYTGIKAVRLHDAGKEEPAIAVYPNPVIDNLHITLPVEWQNKAVQVVVYSSNGTVMNPGAITNSNSSLMINTKQLQKGLYVVKVTCGNSSSQQRIIKN